MVASHRQEVVARSGTVELAGETADTLVALRLHDRARTGFATASGEADPAAVVERARAVLGHLPPAEEVPADDRKPRAAAAEEPWMPLSVARTLAQELVRGDGGAAEYELRCSQERRRVWLASSLRGASSYVASVAAAVFRATSWAGEAVGHAEQSDHDVSLHALLERAAERVRGPALAQARLLARGRPFRGPLPDRVVVDAAVAGRLVALLGESFRGDAVAEQRSRLAGRLGEAVATPCVTLVDDPLAPEAPFRAPLDDEGSATRRRVLVRAGVLQAFLADRRFAERVPGAPPGSGWRHPPRAAPRPRPCNLFVAPGREPLPGMDAPLRLVQTYGMHMANNVTGDFSVGAAAVVGWNGDEVGVTGLTVAGNVLDLLRDVEAVGPELRWIGSGTTHYGASDLFVRGLSLGW